MTKSIVRCFEKRVEEHGDRIAVKTDTSVLTYRQLNDKANIIASHITEVCESKGEFTSLDNTVAMLFEHGADMINGLMGVLKTGKIYVPLDPSYPFERLAYMLKDSNADLILTNNKNSELANKLVCDVRSSIRVINVDLLIESPEVAYMGAELKSTQKVYILYTSGSTGKPKGVVQTDGNILHFIDCYSKKLHITPTDRIALFTSYSHTVAVIDIFTALLNGAAIYPYDIKLEGSMGRLAGWINDEKITVFHSVPTVFRLFMETVAKPVQISSIRAMVIGGEAVYANDLELYKRYCSDNCLFVNLFGSSEVIIATANILDKSTELKCISVPVGFSVDGVDITLVNDSGLEVGINETGEIMYKSLYLAPGYWNMEDYSKGVFSADNNDIRVLSYRSGDLGRLLQDGSIEYLGRKDFQVKIRGNRVEVGEIETKLLNHPSVKEGAVIAKRDHRGNNYICAFIVSGAEVSLSDIKQYLKSELPEYMVPSYVVQIDKMPLTENGKLDRMALQSINIKIATAGIDAKPANDLEKLLVDVWKEILDVEQINMNDSFYDMGGNSILAIKFEVEMEKRNIDLVASDVYELKTIRNLAKKNESRETGGMDKEHNINPVQKHEAGAYCSNNPEAATLTDSRIINNVEPFNDVFYRSCYLNSLIPIVRHFNKDLMPLLVNDIIGYQYKNGDMQNIIQYMPVEPVEKILDNIGIKSLSSSDDSNLCDRINTAISNGRPVVLWIDCFYSPVRVDAYNKSHFEHCILIYGYDNTKRVYSVIEHRHRDNLSYEKKLIPYQDIINCCKGYVNDFYGKKVDMPVYSEYYSVCTTPGRIENPDELKTYKHIFNANMINRKDGIFKGIYSMKDYCKDFENITGSEEMLEKHAESIFSGINNVINIKQVERYRLDKLYGETFEGIGMLDEILADWSEVRKMTAKYVYSSVYKKESFSYAVEKLKEIYEKEHQYNEVLFLYL
ncbi:AMP-binding protein [Acetivibrio cellulolyticus]|uniref:AMP-binding protein n=1 Tax=Acetivibrio cellulolyticus TaxID=35830 RepID=UPI0002481B22|nr:AMP-binding protein [Acetivibrio cellulolyticus]